MIIPIKCFTCGSVLADKYIYYQETVRAKKLALDTNADQHKVIYLTPENIKKTPEGITMDELEITSICCRRHIF